MFTKMIAVVAILASGAVALASDASLDQAQLSAEKAATKSTGAEAPSTAAAPCGCCSHSQS